MKHPALLSTITGRERNPRWYGYMDDESFCARWDKDRAFRTEIERREWDIEMRDARSVIY